ncbi:MAG TPA: hypothetical protein VGD06_16585 [Acidobacteriota bacterium]|jgi:hypothetical protein
MSTAAAPGYEILSRADGRELFDRKAREWLGISGEEFVRRYDAGEYDGVDCSTKPKLFRLLMLLPFAR